MFVQVSGTCTVFRALENDVFNDLNGLDSGPAFADYPS